MMMIFEKQSSLEQIVRGDRPDISFYKKYFIYGCFRIFFCFLVSLIIMLLPATNEQNRMLMIVGTALSLTLLVVAFITGQKVLFSPYITTKIIVRPQPAFEAATKALRNAITNPADNLAIQQMHRILITPAYGKYPAEIYIETDKGVYVYACIDGDIKDKQCSHFRWNAADSQTPILICMNFAVHDGKIKYRNNYFEELKKKKLLRQQENLSKLIKNQQNRHHTKDFSIKLLFKNQYKNK